jgi:hypothetical protein
MDHNRRRPRGNRRLHIEDISGPQQMERALPPPALGRLLRL